MITVIGIAGSPRRNGNSTTLLSSVLKGAESKGARTETVHLNDLLYKGCQGVKREDGKLRRWEDGKKM
jgi:multimeric flavodoxin WrbA